MISEVSLDRRKFVPQQNSENGEVSSSTIFEFFQKDDLVEAKYYGGTIVSGNIIGRFISPNRVELLYNCLTTAKQLKAGKAIAEILQRPEGTLSLQIEWEWLNGDHSKGSSQYIEFKE